MPSKQNKLYYQSDLLSEALATALLTRLAALAMALTLPIALAPLAMALALPIALAPLAVAMDSEARLLEREAATCIE